MNDKIILFGVYTTFFSSIYYVDIEIYTTISI
ncbi:hypothetical protein ES707_14712 [subsurface metagenome]